MEKKRWNKNKFLVLWLVSVAAFIAVGIVGFLTFWRTVGSVAWLVVATFLLIWYYLSPNNMFFTFITEGTAKIIVKGGEVVRILIVWKGKIIDKTTGDVIPGKKSWWYFCIRIGGCYLYGFWPIWQVYIYHLRWTSVQQDGSPSKHDEDLDFVLLKDHTYYLKVVKAEDKDMVPLDIILFIIMRVVNPYKAIFIAQDYVELVLGKIVPVFRQYVGGASWLELKSQGQEKTADFWKKIVATGMIKEFKDDYGVEIKEGGITMPSIDAPKGYQEAATKKYVAEREREKRVAETVGTVLESLAYSQNKTVEDVQKEIASDPRLQKYFLDTARDMIIRQMGIDGKAYIDARVVGAEGLERAALNFLTIWQKMAGRGDSTGGSRSSGRRGRQEREGQEED